MATVIPVSVVRYNSDERCTEILRLRTDSMAPLCNFKEQLAAALSQRAKTMIQLTYRGNPVYAEAKMYTFAAECDAAPRFAVSYFPSGLDHMTIDVVTLTGKKLTLVCR